MAKGSQDWVARTDLLLQTLGEIIQRPRYGVPHFGTVSGYVAANTINPIIAISGGGFHYGIYFWGESSGLADNDYTILEMDGEAITMPTIKQLFDGGYIASPMYIQAVTLYDPVGFKYAGYGCTQKTWNTSYTLYYVETHGRNPYMTVKWVYALF
jgi:hypothetical protein